MPLSPSSIIWYQRKLGSKQAYRVVHQPVSRGFAVFADAWLSGWLAEINADLRENGSALEVVLHDYALYKSTFTLLYFTPICSLASTENNTDRVVVCGRKGCCCRQVVPVWNNLSLHDSSVPTAGGCKQRTISLESNMMLTSTHAH